MELGQAGSLIGDDQIYNEEDLSHPEGQSTFPQMELEAVINAVRLTSENKRVFEDRPKNRQILTNSLAMMWILQTESGKLKQFVGARVSKVKVKSDVGKKRMVLAGRR
jgi:hypothetical protein